MNVYSSLDGKHWKLEWDGTKEEEWVYNTDLEVEENAKTVPLTGVSARYLKLQIMKSRRNYFASHELPVYKKMDPSHLQSEVLIRMRRFQRVIIPI